MNRIRSIINKTALTALGLATGLVGMAQDKAAAPEQLLPATINWPPCW